MFALSEFSATINKYDGLARPYLFVVTMTPPRALQSAFGNIARDLRFFCSGAELPGISVMTSDVRHYNYGPSERRPYAPVFVDTTLTFMLDNKGEILKFFHNWMQNIIDFQGSRGIAGGTVNNAYPYEVHYSDDYVTTVQIDQYNLKESTIVSYKLYDAYPLTLNSVQTSWEGVGTIQLLNTAFTYRSWSSDKLGTTQTSGDSLNSSAVNQQGNVLSLTKNQSINAGSSQGTLRYPTLIADVINTVNNTKIF